MQQACILRRDVSQKYLYIFLYTSKQAQLLPTYDLGSTTAALSKKGGLGGKLHTAECKQVGYQEGSKPKQLGIGRQKEQAATHQCTMPDATTTQIEYSQSTLTYFYLVDSIILLTQVKYPYYWKFSLSVTFWKFRGFWISVEFFFWGRSPFQAATRHVKKESWKRSHSFIWCRELLFGSLL